MVGYPHIAVEKLPKETLIGIWDGDGWERLNFTSEEEMETYLQARFGRVG